METSCSSSLVTRKGELKSSTIGGNWDAIGDVILEEGLDLKTIILSSLGNCSSMFELSFMEAAAFRETEQNVG